MAANEDIVITEIGAHEHSDHEWIEIYNNGTSAIDLTGWKFYEDETNHSLSAYRGGMLLAPGQYAVIADVAASTATDYPTYTGILIDSSWGALNEGGESIGLRTKEGVLIEQFTYLALVAHSLERADSLLRDYTVSNWHEHLSGSTIGQQNSTVQSQPVQPAPVQEVASSTAPISQPEPAASSSTSTIAVPPELPPPTSSFWRATYGDILINEFVSDPADAEKEWVELYNTTSHPVDLSGWTFEDGSRAVTQLKGVIGTGALRYLVIENPVGSLNNAGDRMTVKDKDKNIIDDVAFGAWDDGVTFNNAPAAQDPSSVARIRDGANSFNNKFDFKVTTTPTRGGSNVITEKSEVVDQSQPFTRDIVISELLPNPLSNETKEEYIEITNVGKATISVDGWELVSATSKRYSLNSKQLGDVSLDPGEVLAIFRTNSGIALKNTGGDVIRLFQPGFDKPSASVMYHERALQGQAYARTVDGSYQWTLHPTPGHVNEIVKNNEAPEVVLEAPISARVGENIIVDATDSTDVDLDTLTYVWDFGDHVSDTHAYVAHTYGKEGDYIIMLKVSDGSHEIRKTAKIKITKISAEYGVTVKQEAMSGGDGVLFSEVLPNPKGADTSEFIELYNASSQEITLSGWLLKVDSSQGKYIFPDTTRISGGEYLLVPRTQNHLTFKNSTEVIVLYRDDGNIVDSIEYDDAPSGQSLARTTTGNWVWTASLSPGKSNNVDALEKDSFDVSDISSSVYSTVARATLARSTKTSMSATHAVSLEDLRELPKNTHVEIQGIVSVEPGVFGKTVFYIAGSGIQIYNAKKSFPQLRLGDRITVSGVLSESNDEMRIRIKDASDIHVLTHEKPPEPKSVEGDEVDESHEGWLVRVSGVLSDIRWPTLVLTSDGEDVKISVKKTTGIKKGLFAKGDQVDIIGVVSQTAAGYRILPRYASDIFVVETPSEAAAIAIPGRAGEGFTILSYFLVTAGALAVTTGGLFIHHRRKK